jgi:hypothetical protein
MDEDQLISIESENERRNTIATQTPPDFFAFFLAKFQALSLLAKGRESAH